MNATADLATTARGHAPDGTALAAYWALALPVTMTALPINILLPAFYAANTALPLAAIGAVLLATRLVDAIADPLLGAWIDAQKHRSSYRRPILIGAVPLAIGFVALFSPPSSISAGVGSTATWLALTLIASYLGYSLATIAYQAWGAELAHDDAGRARVTAGREGAGLLGVVLGATVPTTFGMTALLPLFVVLLAGALLLLRRAPPPLRTSLPADVTGGIYSRFWLPLKTSRFRWLLTVFALNATAPAMTATVFQFFVADRLGLESYTGLFLVLYFLAGAVSMPLWSRLARHFSLHGLWLAGMIASVAAFVWAFWLESGSGPGTLVAFAAICVISGLAFGADLALPPALAARVIDANGHCGSREGSYFGLWNLVNKLCLALAGGIALPLLQGLGYERGATDADALGALAFAYAVVPCVLKLFAAAVLAWAWRRERF